MEKFFIFGIFIFGKGLGAKITFVLAPKALIRPLVVCMIQIEMWIKSKKWVFSLRIFVYLQRNRFENARAQTEIFITIVTK